MSIQNNMMRMDVWIRDDRGEQNKLLVDTGTLYSQYLYTGPITFNGIDERGSKGTLKIINTLKNLEFNMNLLTHIKE